MTTTSHRSLRTRQAGAVRILTLDRPEVLNAFDPEMLIDLHEQLIRARRDPSIRTIVITGAGRAFSSGGDLKFALRASPERPGDAFLALTKLLHGCIEEIRATPKPVVAALGGVAAGAGLFLALACDLRVMSDRTYLKQSNSSHGLSLPAGGTFTLPRLVGVGRALEMVMLDRPIGAERALELGLVTELAPEASFAEHALAFAQSVARMPQHALAETKRLLNAAFTRSLSEQLEAERRAIARSANGPEGREGLRAFVEGRKPDYAAAAGAGG